MTLKQKPSNISIANLLPGISPWRHIIVAILDRILGIKKMDSLYQRHEMQGLSKEAFSDKLIDILELDITGSKALQDKVPKSGPVVIASNHPFGGIEGVILARLIGEVRPDLKVLANKGLGIFSELKDYFIFTNPLKPNDPKNAPSIRHCLSHLKQNGALLMFPAGKVSYFNKQKNATSECTWNKLLAKLISTEQCLYLPVFVNGQNSKFFYTLERIAFKLRMFLLGWELLNKKDQRIEINAGNALLGKKLRNDIDYQRSSELCRALSYAQDPIWRYQWPEDIMAKQKPIAAEISKPALISELETLPSENKLVSSKGFTAYYGYQAQIPNIVLEIARLRELVFREHDEGSGESIDTDSYDETYTHLFIIDEKNMKIIGAYRMGLTDILLKEHGPKGLYLNQMFQFKPSFVNNLEPCMEMGRSFLIPEMQGSYIGLLMLWKGIGAFICKYPRYRTLYGTVSISKLYDPRSVKLIQQGLITPDSHHHVEPINEFDFESNFEIDQFAKDGKLSDHLSAFLGSIEKDRKDVPILAKQYQKLGAHFHALGIDKSFNHTPGLLLSVRVPDAPNKLLKLYLGDGWYDYVNWTGAKSDGKCRNASN